MDDRRATAERQRRRPGPISREYLLRAAVHYLERYASSADNLRRVLKRKVARRVRERGEGEDAAGFETLIGETLARLLELKLLDDRSFAEARVATLRRRGTSTRLLAARLAEKGVDRETAERAMAGDGTSEPEAAASYARRRRLGPHRLRDRAERRDRDVAAMVRAGFAYGLAAAVIDGEPDGPSGCDEEFT